MIHLRSDWILSQKKIRQNEALKNKKNACGHRKQNGVFQQKHNIFFKKTGSPACSLAIIDNLILLYSKFLLPIKRILIADTATEK
ncbi:hypothetical protein VK97_02830 [Bacillus sp. LK10]|nr:hypothetical protein VL09_02965 [Bacillus stratosphericus]KML61555.1 hypothetical protein VL19_09200 [Bacillus stratosphericus]KMN33640.1 hypothetical protein ABW26_05300 [Bacillus stratosphericus]KMN75594.1 hypothetical protein VK97_02830 [Bacillus sp. LK10]